MTLREQIEARRTSLLAERAIAEAATPGPWHYNSYNAIFSAPLSVGYDEWSDTWGEHTVELRGECPACPPREYGGCAVGEEDYDRNPMIGGVPAHHGDTAVRRRAMDAEHIARQDPASTLARVDRELRGVDADLALLGTCHLPVDQLDPSSRVTAEAWVGVALANLRARYEERA